MFVAARRVIRMVVLLFLLVTTFSIAQADGIGFTERPLDRSAPQRASTVPQLGMWVPGAPGDQQALDETERLIGRDLDIVHWFQAWGSPTNHQFRSDSIARLHAAGTLPLITWEPWTPGRGVDQPDDTFDTITAGAHDAYIRAWAQAADATGGPILLRLAHEMNGSWYPWTVGVNGNTAADFLAAWTHVRDIFSAEGARNVGFVWSPNVAYPGSTPLAEVFPGDAQVEWVALDGYNWGTERAGATWRSFNTTFGASYAELVTLSTRPLMIAETASAELGGDKAQWIREGLALGNLREHFPRIRAIVWFNERKSGNWPIQSSTSATKAFRDTVRRWR